MKFGGFWGSNFQNFSKFFEIFENFLKTASMEFYRRFHQNSSKSFHLRPNHCRKLENRPLMMLWSEYRAFLSRNGHLEIDEYFSSLNHFGARRYLTRFLAFLKLKFTLKILESKPLHCYKVTFLLQLPRY